ncbi:MAG: hypothetical protein KAI24_19815 [Planctomycetes bacterium]|nr:hypothetical protein [Planctomycetota bacterium]
MMRFAEPTSPSFGSRRERPFWRIALFAAAVTGVIAASQPWVRVRFERLFGELFGPPAWQTSAGFTCLCTCALVAVITLAETHTRSAQRAVRPASLLLAGVMALSVLLYVLRGPGMLRGVSAAWTTSLYVGSAACFVLLAACIVRFCRARAPRARRSAD